MALSGAERQRRWRERQALRNDERNEDRRMILKLQEEIASLRNEVETLRVSLRNENSPPLMVPPPSPLHPPSSLPLIPPTSDSPSGESGATSAPDPIKAVFDAGIRILAQSGIPEGEARKIVGKARKQLHNDDGRLLGILVSVERIKPVDPKGYFLGACQKAAAPREGALFGMGVA